MSFYALPGPLHARSDDERNSRPLFTLNTLDNTGESNAFAQAMSKRGTNVTTDSATARAEPYSPMSMSGEARVILDFSKMEPDARSSKGMTYQHSYDKIAGHVSSSHHQQFLKIRVTEAVVDILKLVSPSPPCSSFSRGRKGVNTSLDTMRHTRHGRLRRRQQQDSTRFASSRFTCTDLDPYERALDLELEISYAGRSYTAKRPLQKIIQFRRDLLEELAFQEQIHNGRSLSHSRSDSLDESESLLSLSSCSQSFGGSSLGSSSSVDGDCSTQSLEGQVIPDLPGISDSSLGVLGSGGFKQINVMRHAFRGALEEWFQQVLHCVPDDSPTLARFLWEPLSANSLDSLHSSLRKLGSIQEN